MDICTDSSDVFNSMKNGKKASTSLREQCDEPIHVEEIKWGIKNLKMNKSPGNDGLTAEFYQAFSEEISEFLLAVYNEALSKEELPPFNETRPSNLNSKTKQRHSHY